MTLPFCVAFPKLKLLWNTSLCPQFSEAVTISSGFRFPPSSSAKVEDRDSAADCNLHDVAMDGRFKAESDDIKEVYAKKAKAIF